MHKKVTTLNYIYFLDEKIGNSYSEYENINKKYIENSCPKNNAFLEMNWKKIRHATAF